MPEFGEAVAGGDGADDGHPEDCVFCAEWPRELKGYKTKHGLLKDEDDLAESLRSNAKELTTDKKVGPVYPLPGGSDPTMGWVAKAGALEEFEVEIGATPHHIIPGKASMAKSRLEQWTRAEKGKIKEDIGYSIDCARNGVFLPKLPDLYGTKHKVPGVTMAQFYGQTWRALSPTSKEGVGFLVMKDTWLQLHYTDHSKPYKTSPTMNYDKETRLECDQLAHLAERFRIVCERSKDDDGKRYPPYSLVHLINQKSDFFRMRITGRPDQWKSWVSTLAEDLSMAVRQGRELLVSKLALTKKTRG